MEKNNKEKEKREKHMRRSDYNEGPPVLT